MSVILVVEDNVNLAAGLTRGLETDGHRVLVAHDGNEALERASGTTPDLMILDLMRNDLSRVCDPDSVQVTAVLIHANQERVENTGGG